ncbi:MAG: WbqC family protein [Muribaculum sp.]|nr:WbqC family protein [Muribaculum sp.]
MTTPYLPSLEWYAQRVSVLLGTDTVVLEHPALRRSLMRCLIKGDKMLSVPITGGGSVLKHADPRKWEVSDHGRWTDVHLGALSAEYGTAPFYRHFMPELEPLIRNHPDNAMAFTKSLCLWIERKLKVRELLPYLRDLSHSDINLYMRKRTEILTQCDPSLSVIDPLFRLGPEAIFALLPKK